MRLRILFLLVMASAAPCAFAVDGVVLINQSTVMAAGGFPYKITQPGSYRLSGNLQVTAVNTDAIDIQTSHVTLDLNGFSISGPVICTGTGADLSCSPFSVGLGISSNGSWDNIIVRNGSVKGFNGGIQLGALGFGQAIVEEILVSSNLASGIFATSALVRRCVAVRNGTGIEGDFLTVTDNVLSYNFNGLAMTDGLFGSNTFWGNGISITPGSRLSQSNNACDGSTC